MLTASSFLCSKQLRFGILSTSRFNEPIIEAIRMSSKSTVVAIASRNLEKAQNYAKDHNIPIAYGSYDALLADPNIDVIFNPLPNSLHGEWTIKALQAGKHVLCEKPMVTTREDFEQIKQLAAEHKLVVAEGLAYFYHPQTRILKKLLTEQVVGKIRLMSATLHIQLDTGHLSQVPEHGEIRLNPHLGGGTIWDLGIYCSSIMILVAQHIAQVSLPKEVHAQTLIGPTGVDIASMATFRFTDELLGMFSTCFYSPFKAALILYGEKGRIELDGPWHGGFFSKSSINVIYEDGTMENHLQNLLENCYIYEIAAMEDAILDGKELLCSLEHSEAFLNVLLALHESAQNKAVTDLK